MNEKALRAALEVCRPGSDDLSLPELAELARQLADSPEWRAAWQRVQQVDEAIGGALHDVPIPVDLESRLLAQVGESPTAEAAAPAPETPGSPAVVERRLSRRAWWSIATVVAACAVAAVWGIQQWRQPPVLQAENLGFEALAWAQRLTDDWRDLSDASALDRPIDRQVRFGPRGWQPLATDQDANAVAYDLTRSRGMAMLFVLAPAEIPAEVSTIASRVPATGGWGAAAWRSGPHVYVLLVEERRQKLDDFLANPSSQIVRGPARPVAATDPRTS